MKTTTTITQKRHFLLIQWKFLHFALIEISFIYIFVSVILRKTQKKKQTTGPCVWYYRYMYIFQVRQREKKNKMYIIIMRWIRKLSTTVLYFFFFFEWWFICSSVGAGMYFSMCVSCVISPLYLFHSFALFFPSTRYLMAVLVGCTRREYFVWAQESRVIQRDWLLHGIRHSLNWYNNVTVCLLVY